MSVIPARAMNRFIEQDSGMFSDSILEVALSYLPLEDACAFAQVCESVRTLFANLVGKNLSLVKTGRTQLGQLFKNTVVYFVPSPVGNPRILSALSFLSKTVYSEDGTSLLTRLPKNAIKILKSLSKPESTGEENAREEYFIEAVYWNDYPAIQAMVESPGFLQKEPPRREWESLQEDLFDGLIGIGTNCTRHERPVCMWLCGLDQTPPSLEDYRKTLKFILRKKWAGKARCTAKELEEAFGKWMASINLPTDLETKENVLRRNDMLIAAYINDEEMLQLFFATEMLSGNRRWRQAVLSGTAISGRLELFERLCKTLLSDFDDKTLEQSMNVYLAGSAMYGHLEIVKFILNKYKISEFGIEGALKSSARYGYLEVVRYLLDTGKARQFNIKNALEKAIGGAHSEVVKILLDECKDEKGQYKWTGEEIDFLLRHIQGKAALSPDIVNLLLKTGKETQQGIDRALGEFGRCQKGVCLDVIKSLLETGKATELGIDRALYWDALHSRPEFVTYLLSTGKVTERGIDSALSVAASCGHSEVVRLLLATKKATQQGIDKALSKAASCGHSEVVNLLLDIDKVTERGIDSALSIAANQGHSEVVNLLLDTGKATVEGINDALYSIGRAKDPCLHTLESLLATGKATAAARDYVFFGSRKL